MEPEVFQKHLKFKRVFRYDFGAILEAKCGQHKSFLIKDNLETEVDIFFDRKGRYGVYTVKHIGSGQKIKAQRVQKVVFFGQVGVK